MGLLLSCLIAGTCGGNDVETCLSVFNDTEMNGSFIQREQSEPFNLVCSSES